MSFATLRTILAHPLTRGLSIDDPRTTDIRRQIIAQKPFLQAIYREWYGMIAAALPPVAGPTLELGSGAGFLEDYVPGLIPSDVFFCQGIKVVLDGCHLPFGDSSLRAIVMMDVLHHISRPRQFLTEASRCVRSGGKMVMIEPWVTPWSRWVYTRLHWEPFRPESTEWEFAQEGPLSGANGALPWIIFQRDRSRFESEYPQWRINQVRPFMPFRHLVSGGVSFRALMPYFSFPVWRGLERSLERFRHILSLFAMVELERR